MESQIKNAYLEGFQDARGYCGSGYACCRPTEADTDEDWRNSNAARREAELVAEVERLRGLVEKAFSEGFWNGFCVIPEQSDQETNQIKMLSWGSSNSKKSLRGEVE